jgi:hypothetical protein
MILEILDTAELKGSAIAQPMRYTAELGALIV